MSALARPAAPKAPFPWYGGKSRAASLIWERFGDCPNYVEPFAGSLAVLLSRPHAPRTETVNDADGLLSNAWRAIRADPDAVAYHADQPVVEVDLTARHVALVQARDTLTARLEADPEYFDARLAGFWVWGACNWIGSGWCSGRGPWAVQDGLLVKGGGGLARVTRQLPHLGNAGKGDSLPGIDNPGLYEWMRALSARLRRVRICCGDWTRVMGESVTTKHGMTAVLLDPPYASEDADNDVYGVAHCASVAASVREWAIANGDDPLLRLALCSYDGDFDMPLGWVKVGWKARKGYQAVREDGSHNGHREVVWFNRACIVPAHESPLFGSLS